MALTKIGAYKIAAKKTGISLDVYLQKIKLEKRCYRCKKWINRQDFNKDRSRNDGLKSKCNFCSRVSDEKRKVLINGIKKTPSQIYKDWYHKKGAFSVRQRNYARKRKLLRIDQNTYDNIMEEFDYKCAYCDKPGKTLDHLYPVKLGGDSYGSNLVPACVSCNSSKRSQNVFEWAEKKGIILSEKIIEKMSLGEVTGNGYYFDNDLI